MSFPYAEPPGTPTLFPPRFGLELMPTPAAVIDGTGAPIVGPTCILLLSELPRSGVCDTICGDLTVGRSVVKLSFSFGVGLVDGKTSAFGSGCGVSVDTSILL